jgi:hypothetical protein
MASVSVDLTLAASTAREEDVRELLREAADEIGEKPVVELLWFDAEIARYRVSMHSNLPDARSQLNTILAQALTAAGVPLARATRAHRPEAAPSAHAR